METLFALRPIFLSLRFMNNSLISVPGPLCYGYVDLAGSAATTHTAFTPSRPITRACAGSFVGPPKRFSPSAKRYA